ncbi:MAG: hypothetical protein Q7T18_07055 [Sedimentisphaerales bacterium]|nr:hypothetical protein [Sedimentisphaerales bacterium]
MERMHCAEEKESCATARAACSEAQKIWVKERGHRADRNGKGQKVKGKRVEEDMV